MHALTLASLLPSCSKKSPTTRRPDRQIEAEKRHGHWPHTPRTSSSSPIELAGAPDDDHAVLDMERRHTAIHLIYMWMVQWLSSAQG
jgi:hypothetical protein